jgi:hypothetical protein
VSYVINKRAIGLRIDNFRIAASYEIGTAEDASYT